MLGVVDDYAIQFKVSVNSVTSRDIEKHLIQYRMKYQFEGNAESVVTGMPVDSVTSTLKYAIELVIKFVYSEIVIKRKHAIRTMGEMCREFKNDEEFRDAILSYLQESEYSEILRTWLNRPFDEIGLETIKQLLNEVENLEQIKRLIGTSRRMLDAAPDNIALHFLSVCSRIRNNKESDNNIVDEATSFVRHVIQHRIDFDDTCRLLVSLVEEVHAFRNELTVPISDSILRRYGDTSLARDLLASEKIASVPIIRHHALVLLAANALETVEHSGFYHTLIMEPKDAR